MSPGVISFFHRVVAFVRWVSAPEQLPESPAVVRDADLQPEGLFQGAECAERGSVRSCGGLRSGSEGFLQWLISSEVLDPPAAETAAAPSGGFSRWLFSLDTLPTLPQAGLRGSGGQGLVRHVLSAENCPVRSATPKGRVPGMARWLLATEECPTVDTPCHHGGTGLLRGIVTPEVCPTTSECSERRHKGFVRWILSSQDCPRGDTPDPRRRKGFASWLFSQEEL